MRAETYDIINAGPKHRFMADGRIVSNSGRKFQPQNLPSLGLLPTEQIDLGIPMLKAGAADLMFDDVMALASSAIRGCVVAPPGKKLVVTDLSNIEGRALAWLAGENWKLDAFREFDAGTGPDLYKVAYGRMFGIDPHEVTKDQRQIGKTVELACGYQGSLGAFITFAVKFGIDLDAMADKAWDALPKDAVEKAEGLYDWYQKQRLSTFGLQQKTAVTILCFVYGWREAHAATSAMWKSLEAAYVEAVNNPGVTLTIGRFKVRRDGWWLRIAMPSGRALCYPSPRVDEANKCSYLGKGPFTHKFGRTPTYGGRITENLTQSFSRDILYDSMPAITDAGYEIVFSVHDEVVCEAPDSPEFNAEHLSEILAAPPTYAQDMPLAAKGFDGYRYKKD